MHLAEFSTLFAWEAEAEQFRVATADGLEMLLDALGQG